MRAVIQRVVNSRVLVENSIVSSIGNGLNILLGVNEDDSLEDAEYIADKIVKMRIFNDESGKLNLSLHDIKAELLVVSQFTLYANCRKGNRPSFTYSAGAEKARQLYEYFIEYLRIKHSAVVKTGVFGADMRVEIINDGPVTIVLDSEIRKDPR